MENQHYNVVGVTFEDRQEILSDFFKNYRHGGKYNVKLVHEADNQYDSNAVAVQLDVGGGVFKGVGYISRQENKALSQSVDAGKVKSASLRSIGPNYKGDIGLTIEAEVED